MEVTPKPPLDHHTDAKADAGEKQGLGEESEDESDEEESKKISKGEVEVSPRATGRSSATLLQTTRFSKMIKLLKPEKAYGPSPFEKATADRYEVITS